MIYGSKKVYEKYNNWNKYRYDILIKQPLWWILESLYIDKKPFGYSKEKLVKERIDDLWESFIESLDKAVE